MVSSTKDINHSRIVVVDALRGLALLGILIANIPYMPDPSGVYQTRSLFIGSPVSDRVLNIFFHLLVDKKFITIFGILFGFGFYIQMRRAIESGVNFRTYFLIRMILLFFIGNIHAYLLWFGDIIRYYAICGMFLLLFYQWTNKKLLICALTFNVLITASIYILNGILGLPDYQYDLSLASELPITTSWWRYLYINATIDPIVNFVNDSILTFVFSFGNILLGFLLGNISFFQQPDKFRKYLKPVMIGGFIIGMGASYLFFQLKNGALELTPSLIWLPYLIVAGLVWQSLFYIAVFIKLFKYDYLKYIFIIFAPVGKMALTNYIVQSAFYIMVFFHAGGGLKLYGKITLTETFILAIFLFMLQVLFSKYWLIKFSQGPIEYIWKKICYKFYYKQRHLAS